MTFNSSSDRVILWVSLSIWLVSTMRALGQDELRTFKNPGWVGSVAFDPVTGNAFAACADGVVRKWDVNTGKEVLNLKGHSNAVSSIALGTRVAQVVTGSYDGTVRSWPVRNLADGEFATFLSRKAEVTHRGAVLSMACDQFGRAASGGMDGTIKITEIGKTDLTTARGHKSWVNALDFFHSGATNRLASGSSDGTIKVWNSADGKLIRTLDVTNTEVRSLAITPLYEPFKFDDASIKIAVGLRYGDVQIWSAETWERKASFKAHDGDCWAVKFSPDGKTLITGGGDWEKPGEVKFWDVKTGELKATLKHTGEVLCLAVSPDGRRLAAGGGDGSVKVWDTEKLIGIAKRD